LRFSSDAIERYDKPSERSSQISALTAAGTGRKEGFPIGLPIRDPFLFTTASAAFVRAEIRSASNCANEERIPISILPSAASSENPSCSEKSAVAPAF
jgi:hypothetical protein